MINNSKSIVLIDDDETILKMMKTVLSGERYQVETFSDIQLGVEYVNTYLPQLIFLDVWMPNRSGWKVAKSIKNNLKTKSIPIILISADHEVSQLMQYTKADGFLGKPFEIKELLAVVKQYTIN